MSSEFPHVPVTPHEPSIGELVKSLVADLGQLVRTEIARAKAEVSQNLSKASHAGAFIAAGGVLGLAALITLLTAIVAGLAQLLNGNVFLASLIVTVVVGGLGVILIMTGIKRLSAASLAPTHTIASVKQDAETIKGSL